MSYNLLEENWIPVLWCDGKVSRVGIKDALVRAHQIRQIAASNPMDRVAIIRFLLALLYWCKGNPPTDKGIASGGSFPPDWFSKLDTNKDCFNLLGEGKRFYQQKKDGDKERTVNYLIHEVPTGTNKWHFRHATHGVDGLCTACCAMGLLRLPMFATSGGSKPPPGYPPGINSKPPIYVMPSGDSLWKSLLLCWKPVTNVGIPAWEKSDLQLPAEGEVPLLTGLTWLQRRVWLGNPEAHSKSACVLCGTKEHLIRQSVIAGKNSLKQDENGPKRIWRDPHVIYEQSRKGDDVQSLDASDALGSPDAAAGQWTKIMMEVLGKHSEGNIWSVGFATVQNDKYLEAMEYLLPCSTSPHQIQETIEKIKKWQREGGNQTRKAHPPKEKANSRKHVEIAPMLASIRPHVEAQVSAKAGELLTGDDAAWQKAAEEYRPMMEAVAKSLSPGFTTAALKRRNHIAKALPDMRPKVEPEKKPAKKKGVSK